MKKKFILSVIFLLIVSAGIGIFSTGIKVNAATLKVGDKVTLGSYEQDNNTDNGKESVSWIVLDAKDGKALVLSEKILDCRAFHTKSVSAWSTSSLRTWLNDTFYSDIFSDTEKSYVKANSTICDSSGITDNIFLLSKAEFKAYSGVFKKSGCVATKYAVGKNLFTQNGNGYWWLRDEGHDSQHVMFVNPDGSLYVAGSTASYLNFGGIRPAMWIDLKASSLGGNTLTVNYVYDDGRTAYNSYFAAISPGDSYNITSPTFDNYKADKDVVSGSMGDSDLVVTVTYKNTLKKDRLIYAPQKQSYTDGNLVLQTAKTKGDGTIYYGFSKSDDVNSVTNWQTSTSFSGFVGGNTYYFFAKVTGSSEYNDSYSESMKLYIEKTARTIDAPKIASYNHISVSAYEISAYGGGEVSYGISLLNNPIHVTEWKQYPVFKNLTSGTKYYLFARAAETDNYAVAYSYSEFTTTAAKSGTAIPDIIEVTSNNITVEALKPVIGQAFYAIAELEDKNLLTNWTSDNVFQNLNPGQRYYIYVRIDGNPNADVSEYNFVTVMTKVGERVVAKPVAFVSGTTVVVEKMDVVGNDFVCYGISKENNADTVSVWQVSNVYENLDENTEYYVFAKLSNGNTSEDLISEGAAVKTTVHSDTNVDDIIDNSNSGNNSGTANGSNGSNTSANNSGADNSGNDASGNDSNSGESNKNSNSGESSGTNNGGSSTGDSENSDDSDNDGAAAGSSSPGASTGSQDESSPTEPDDNESAKAPSDTGSVNGDGTTGENSVDSSNDGDSDSDKNKDGKGSAVWAIVIVIVVVLLAGGGAAAYYFLVYKKKNEGEVE